MIKTATLTFHASHNYGSMLQAYALQRVLLGLGCENEIVNLRIDTQREMYCKPICRTSNTLRQNRRILRINLRTGYALVRKYNKFEKFLKRDLHLSNKRYTTLEELETILPNYDYYISGSDQIWNTHCYDFTWAYYLPFANGKGVAYAPSMGPKPHEEVVASNYETIATYLKGYKAISVREQGTADIVASITKSAPSILVDPTMLLSKEDWERKIAKKPIVKEPYIYLYTPFYKEELSVMAQELSTLLKMKVVVSNFENRAKMREYPDFLYKFNTGPWEFLNLVKNAAVVLSGSYHAVLFSILLGRPFLAKNGMQDNRIVHILRALHLEDRSIEMTNIPEKAKIATTINYQERDAFLQREKERSIQFLKTALDL